MMKNTLKNKGKKLKLTTLGFTLIELLATIVILAIILLIAVPIVLNIIESVRVSAFKASATNIGRSAQLTYTSEMIKKQDSGRLEFYYEKEEGVIKEKSNKVGVFLDYHGERPDKGIVVVNKQGKVDLVLYNEKYKLCAIKKYEENKVKVEKNISEKDCVDKISRPMIEIIGENPLILEYERDGIYNLGEVDYIAYTSEGEETNNVKIYVDEIETREISRGIIKKEYKVVYRVIEGEMFTEVERIIKIVDTIKPVLTIPGNKVLTISEVEGYDLMEGVSVEDNSEEEIEVIIEGSIAKIAGSYEITYKAKDSSGNEAIATRVIDVIDNEAPVITIIGDNPISINVGEEYNDQGATANDDADGDISDAIIPSGSVNTNIPGTYYITYYIIDSSENEATATRTINVIDNIAPTVTFGTNGNSSYAKNHSTTVTVSDQHGTVSNRYYQWTTSTTTPTSGTFSQIFVNGASITSPSGVTGDYYLWIKGVDNSNNEVIVRSNAFKSDNTVPVVTSVVSGASNIGETSFTITRNGNASDAHSGLSTNPYIYQTSPNGSTWTTRCTNNTTSCAVSGLTENTTYYYRICVNDILGNQSCVAGKTMKTLIVGFDSNKGVNKPVLATGMIPIKWNGSSWIDTTVTDPEWYEYSSSAKKWANARTADNSMWVWIPRYAYQIATCYHMSADDCYNATGEYAGTINIKFLQGRTNTASDGTTVAITPAYSGNSQTNYIKHPAFNFGGEQLGFWIAKFEVSGSIDALEFKPNVSSLRNITAANMFSYSRDMETNSRYGWGTNGVGIDTHMMKNTEWGAVAYLSQSTYGGTKEITANFSAVTGGGNYVSNVAQSTTGNIYGIYDMSGGAWEYVAGIYGSGSDRYYNYYNSYTSSIYGDAVYETTSGSNSYLYCAGCSWYYDWAYMPTSSQTWFIRGGYYNYDGYAGIFGFNRDTGENIMSVSWRVAVLVGDGL